MMTYDEALDAFSSRHDEKPHAEPTARAVEVAALILSDCGCSTDNEVLLMRVAGRISRALQTEVA